MENLKKIHILPIDKFIFSKFDKKSFIFPNLFTFSIFSKTKMSVKEGGDGARHEFVKESDSKTESNYFVDLLKVIFYHTFCVFYW